MPIPVFKPLLPSAADLMRYLRQIDDNRWYTNHGPLVGSFEKRLADLCGVSADCVVTSSNATTALTQTLLAVVGRPEGRKDAYCITPSWTFAATAAAIDAAGLTPYFADVAAPTWALDCDHVHRLLYRLRERGHHVRAVMPVAPFGAPIDMKAWIDFQSNTKTPVVVDAAASFDAVTQCTGRIGNSIPTIVSLHATKAFGVGEGSFVVVGDSALAKRIRAWGNFGFLGSREANVRGLNGKMSEITAAVGLSVLDHWKDVRSEWEEMTRHFIRRTREHAFLESVPLMDTSWVASYGLVRFANSSVKLEEMVRILNLSGIETRRWWGKGCHRQPAYEDCPRESMEVTESLASTVLGLPFWRGLGVKGIDQVFSALVDATRSA
jgi:dTDP-4-amino-4,6-dideoxygalactose transaminase